MDVETDQDLTKNKGIQPQAQGAQESVTDDFVFSNPFQIHNLPVGTAKGAREYRNITDEERRACETMFQIYLGATTTRA